LNLDDGFRLLHAARQAGVFSLQPLDLLGQRIDGGLAAAFLGSQRLEFALLAVASPGGEMRGVQPLAPQQRADGAFVAASFGLVEDRAFVFGPELATLGLGRNLGIGDRPPNCGGSRRGAAGAQTIGTIVESVS